MEKNFEIGQVVYILSEQAQTILPGIVAEEIVVKKLTGNNISWKIKVGAGDKARLFDSSKIKGEIYGSLEEVRQVMTSRLSEYIDKISKEAENRVVKWYGKEIAEKQKMLETNKMTSTTSDDKIDPNVLLTTIENVPEVVYTKNDLRNKIRDYVIPREEEEENGATFIQGPNGEKIPVSISRPKV